MVCTLLSQPRWLFALATNLFPGALYAVDLSDGLFEGDAEIKKIALTIDDGPSPVTAEILAVLAQHNVKTTFFNISGNLDGHEAVVQQAVESGHELGNHLTTDYPSIRLSPEDFETNLITAQQALLPFVQSIKTDATLQWLRPGMGFYSPEMVKTAKKHNYKLVLGSRFPYDTHIHSSRFASAFILSTVQPGDIVVLHDGETRGERTVATLKTILPRLQAQGYEITTISELTTFADTNKTYAGETHTNKSQ